MRILTLKQLTQAHACAEQVKLFKEYFGVSVEVTKLLAVSLVNEFDFPWAAVNLLSVGAEAKCQKVCAAAGAKYSKVSNAALAKYEKNKESWPAWAEYEKVRDAAWGEYRKMCAAAFARFYITDQT